MHTVDKYGVVGNPIAHSRSPEIHQRFAQQAKQHLTYERIEAPLDGFEDKALALREAGYGGLNVTLPFKIDAAKLADDLTPRARVAGAVNTLKFDGDTILGDNTDGIGFVRDLRERLKFSFSDCSVLMLGSGGAVRGLLGSMLDESPRWLAVANRSHKRAEELAEEFGVEAIHFDEIPAEHFDLIKDAEFALNEGGRVRVRDGLAAQVNLLHHTGLLHQPRRTSLDVGLTYSIRH